MTGHLPAWAPCNAPPVIGSWPAQHKGHSRATITCCHLPPAVGRQHSDLTVATLSPGAAGGCAQACHQAPRSAGSTDSRGLQEDPRCQWPSCSCHCKPAIHGRVQQEAGVPTPPQHPRSPPRCSSKVRSLSRQHSQQAARAAQAVSASLPQPSSSVLTHILLSHTWRDSPRSELGTEEGVENSPCPPAPGQLLTAATGLSVSLQQDPPAGPGAGDRGTGAAGEADGSSHPRARCPEQGGAAAPSGAGQQRRAQQMPSWQQEGPRMASCATRAPRSHAAVPSLCPVRVVRVTATTSVLRSSRSLMLMTVNMKQRP